MPAKNRPKLAENSRPGRPSKAETERRRLLEIGVDPALVDPRRILAGIATDASAPATARVAAAKALLFGTASLLGKPEPEREPEDAVIPLPPEDLLTARALALMTGSKLQ